MTYLLNLNLRLLFLVYKHTNDFYIPTLYPATFLNLNNLVLQIPCFPTHMNLSSVMVLLFPFFKLMPFIAPLPLLAYCTVRILNTVLKRSGESKHSCLVLVLRGKEFFLHYIQYLLLAFQRCPLSDWRNSLLEMPGWLSGRACNSWSHCYMFKHHIGCRD